MKIGDLVSNQYYGIGIVTDIWLFGSLEKRHDTVYRVQFKKFNVGCCLPAAGRELCPLDSFGEPRTQNPELILFDWLCQDSQKDLYSIEIISQSQILIWAVLIIVRVDSGDSYGRNI